MSKDRFTASFASLLGLLAAGLLFSEACRAQPIVWLEPGASLAGRTAFFVPAIRDETGKRFDFEPASLVGGALRDALKQRAGITLLEKRDGAHGFIALESSLVDYEAGSVLGRWVFPPGSAGGATWCVVRTVLIDGDSGKVLGEIIANRSVTTGGLFTVGAETRVATGVGREIGEAIGELVVKP